jgi:hypothetical protein
MAILGEQICGPGQGMTGNEDINAGHVEARYAKNMTDLINTTLSSEDFKGLWVLPGTSPSS